MDVLIAGMLSFATTTAVAPLILRISNERGIVGVDVNKKEKPHIPEMGGISSIIGLFSSILILTILTNNKIMTVLLAVLSVVAIASVIGAIDDIYEIRGWKKAMYVMLAGIPLIFFRIGTPEITTPFFNFSLPDFFYFLFLVPIGITGCANALNMSGGYNGLESGEVAVISFFLFLISLLRSEFTAALIFSALLGSSFALFLFNKYPARMFVGDVGTLGMGAGIAAACIVGNIEFFGIICILPTFYELLATIYYGLKGIERRDACMNPVIMEDGRLKPPKGAEKFTFAYFILSKKPLREPELVNFILFIYAICGLFALCLNLL